MNSYLPDFLDQALLKEKWIYQLEVMEPENLLSRLTLWSISSIKKASIIKKNLVNIQLMKVYDWAQKHS